MIAEIIPPSGAPGLPENLMDLAWSGRLAKRVIQHEIKTVRLVAAGIVAVALTVAVIVFLFTFEPVHIALAFPVTIWALTLAIPLIHKISTRKLWIIKSMGSGAYELDETEWFKSDVARLLHEHDAAYSGAGRVNWMIKTPDGRLVPFRPWAAERLNAVRQDEHLVTAANIAGLVTYLNAVQNYAYKKTLGMGDVVKLGVLAAIIGGLLIAIFMFSERLAPGAPTVSANGNGSVREQRAHADAGIAVTFRYSDRA